MGAAKKPRARGMVRGVARGALALCALLCVASTSNDRPLSVGSPTDGHLVAGSELEEGPALRVKAKRARYGLPDLIALLEDGAGDLRERRPRATLVVGDISLPGGGPLPPHRSHRSGRDADVGFVMADEDGRPARLPHFHPVDDEGVSRLNRRFHFDREANWVLVESWLSSPDARVQHIFVSAGVRRLLLDEARRSAASTALRRRAARVLRPHPAHNNHFHVRIACPRRMRRVCVNQPRPPKR